MDKDLIIRILVSLVTFINMLASTFGFNPLPLEEDTIYTVVSAIAMLLSWIWGFWKNNNFTPESKQAQEMLDNLKVNRGEQNGL